MSSSLLPEGSALILIRGRGGGIGEKGRITGKGIERFW